MSAERPAPRGTLRPRAKWINSGVLYFAGVAAAYRPTPATIRVVTALLGDLCTDDKDCTIPNSECSNGGCICSDGYAETSDRQECFGNKQSVELSRYIYLQLAVVLSLPVFNSTTRYSRRSGYILLFIDLIFH